MQIGDHEDSVRFWRRYQLIDATLYSMKLPFEILILHV